MADPLNPGQEMAIVIPVYQTYIVSVLLSGVRHSVWGRIVGVNAGEPQAMRFTRDKLAESTTTIGELGGNGPQGFQPTEWIKFIDDEGDRRYNFGARSFHNAYQLSSECRFSVITYEGGILIKFYWDDTPVNGRRDADYDDLVAEAFISVDMTNLMIEGLSAMKVVPIRDIGTHRIFLQTAPRTWVSNAPFNPHVVRGYDLAVAGQFGGTTGDDVFVLAQSGRNRRFFRDGGGTWEWDIPFSDLRSVNGYDLIAAGQFGDAGAAGDAIFLLARDGRNRLVYRDNGGTWRSTGDAANPDPFAPPYQGVNGYDMIAAGQFGGAGAAGDAIFLLARDGRNRLVYRDNGGTWRSTGDAANPDPFAPPYQGVNGYDMIAAGQFGGAGAAGDAIFLLARDGRNRLVYRDNGGTWRSTGDAANPDPFAPPYQGVNGYDMIAAGQFGDAGAAGDAIFLLARDGRNRLVYRDNGGTWRSTGDAANPDPLPYKGANGYDMMAAGQFGDAGASDLVMFST